LLKVLSCEKESSRGGGKRKGKTPETKKKAIKTKPNTPTPKKNPKKKPNKTPLNTEKGVREERSRLWGTRPIRKKILDGNPPESGGDEFYKGKSKIPRTERSRGEKMKREGD